MSVAKSNSALGFLTIVEAPDQGLFGGYLVLNRAGRPLEFHCTAPVKPNRAQQILYGPTLEPFLFGEQIGQTLLNKAKAQPQVVCTDCAPALAVREFVHVPVALVLPAEGPAGGEGSTFADAASLPALGEKVYRCDMAHARGPSGPVFHLGRNRLAVAALAPDDRQQVLDRLADLAETFDLAEPFLRIREAIDEARKGGQ